MGNGGQGSTGMHRWLLSLLALTTIFISMPPTDAVWSYFSSEEAASEGQGDDPLAASELVSPLVNREIQVSVKAPWPSSPYNIFCEAWAFTKNWDFLDRLAATDNDFASTCSSSSGGSDGSNGYKEATDYIVDLLQQEDEDVQLLRFALTMRSQSPMCELHRGLAEQEWEKLGGSSGSIESVNAFAVVNGEILASSPKDITTTTMSNLPELTEEKRDDLLLPDEPIRPSTPTAASGLVFLYANLGTAEFQSWYNHLVKLQLPFVVRHLGSTKDETPFTALQGYGVRLDIRNVEYKVFDDRRSGDDDDSSKYMVNTSALEELTPHFLAGVNLTKAMTDLGKDDGNQQKLMELQAALWKLQEASEQHSAMIPPAWQRRKLSMQAATVIANAPGNELLTLQDVSQNLPSVASTLVHVDVPESIESVVEPLEHALHNMMRSSGGGLWINGKPLPIERPSFNVFEMINHLQKEQAALTALSSKLTPYLSKEPAQALSKIQKAWSEGDSFFTEPSDEEGGQPEKGTTNAYPRINVEKGEKRAVLYVNDIEKDAMYQRWPTQVRNAVMAMQYGMPPTVRRNLFTILAVYDPTKFSNHMGKALFQQLAQGQFPARMGVLIVDQEDIDKCTEWIKEAKPDEGTPCPLDKDYLWSGENNDIPTSDEELQETPVTARDIHRLFAYIAKEYKKKREVLMMYEQYMGPSLAQNPPSNGRFLSLYDVLQVHGEILVGTQVLREAPTPAEIMSKLLALGNDSGADHSYGYAVRFAVDKGLQVGMGFVNGRPLPIDDDEDAGERVSSIFMEEQEVIFGMIMTNDITDMGPTSVYRKLLRPDKIFKASKNVYPRVHPLLSSPTDGAYVDVEHGFGVGSLLSPSSSDGEKSAMEVDAIFGIDAVLETDSPEGLIHAKTFLSVMDSFSSTVSDTSVSIAFRVIPSTESASKDSLCPILASAKQLGTANVLKIIEQRIAGKDISEAGVDASALEEAINAGTDACSFPPSSDQGLPSNNFVTANGRAYNIQGSSLDEMDIDLLLSMELQHSTTVTKFLKTHLLSDLAHDAVARTAAFLTVAKGGPDRYSPDDTIIDLEKEAGIAANPFRFQWNAASEGSTLKSSVTAIVDPVTETAQRLAPLLQVIRDELKLPLMLVLAPKTILDGEAKIPIASYYRFVADPNAFQSAAHAPNADFENLPTAHTLTVRMDVPEPWDIQQAQSVQDTDNLRCSLQSGCSDDAASGKASGVSMHEERQLTGVEYILNHLLFFGQCYDARGSPPNGLQLTLSEYGQSTSSAPQSQTVEIEADGSVKVESGSLDESGGAGELYSDTLVMKTVGYWQLRANPGLWNLSMDKNSRGPEIFNLMEGDVKSGVPRIYGPAKDNTKRLIMSDFVTSSKILLVKRKPGMQKESLFAPSQSAVATNSDEEDVVHVFSLATGHLYERFLKIMMLSVTKRTSSKVKFWLFENFLSPTFKASAMAMAERIGCEVEFRTYKWPEWLRGQTEKQRIIWGYKILFLDVLFPLNVKKIIYVDADQVVRGDLKELWDMDLQGAPYGYTPMCSSRETTLGYQFWNTGFWKSHLQGKPYHISALYVVDLEKFRQGLVGDQLRSIYQQLSADPGSLANLDQDLPNYAQHQVPIFSLPQEWLWCESWCSDETKKDSKTIDLCNNPLHKEPKVSMAKRIISGELFQESWVELDAEVEMYEKEYLEALDA